MDNSSDTPNDEDSNSAPVVGLWNTASEFYCAPEEYTSRLEEKEGEVHRLKQEENLKSDANGEKSENSKDVETICGAENDSNVQIAKPETDVQSDEKSDSLTNVQTADQCSNKSDSPEKNEHKESKNDSRPTASSKSESDSPEKNEHKEKNNDSQPTSSSKGEEPFAKSQSDSAQNAAPGSPIGSDTDSNYTMSSVTDSPNRQNTTTSKAKPQINQHGHGDVEKDAGKMVTDSLEIVKSDKEMGRKVDNGGKSVMVNGNISTMGDEPSKEEAEEPEADVSDATTISNNVTNNHTSNGEQGENHSKMDVDNPKVLTKQMNGSESETYDESITVSEEPFKAPPRDDLKPATTEDVKSHESETVGDESSTMSEENGQDGNIVSAKTDANMETTPDQTSNSKSDENNAKDEADNANNAAVKTEEKKEETSETCDSRSANKDSNIATSKPTEQQTEVNSSPDIDTEEASKTKTESSSVPAEEKKNKKILLTPGYYEEHIWYKQKFEEGTPPKKLEVIERCPVAAKAQQKSLDAWLGNVLGAQLITVEVFLGLHIPKEPPKPKEIRQIQPKPAQQQSSKPPNNTFAIALKDYKSIITKSSYCAPSVSLNSTKSLASAPSNNSKSDVRSGGLRTYERKRKLGEGSNADPIKQARRDAVNDNVRQHFQQVIAEKNMPGMKTTNPYYSLLIQQRKCIYIFPEISFTDWGDARLLGRHKKYAT